MAKRRRRNPSKRSRLTPGEEGELGARKEGITAFANQAAEGLIDGQPLMTWIWEGQQWEMSWSQIRKGLRRAMNQAITYAMHKSRRSRR